jgi:hypothetical protein
MRAHIVTAALLLSSAVSLDANAPLSMAVSPIQSFAPTNRAIRVHIEPDAGTRALEVVADSGVYYRSSRFQIDGAEAPRTISFEIRDLPGGEYEVTAVLINDAGKAQAAVHKHVIVV